MWSFRTFYDGRFPNRLHGCGLRNHHIRDLGTHLQDKTTGCELQGVPIGWELIRWRRGFAHGLSP